VVHGGDGGNGMTAFRRESRVPRGGPAGGDGGDGGDVILRGDERMGTLLDHSYRRHYKAKKGGNGGGRQMTGRDGEDRVVPVPLGTQAFDLETGDLIADITEHGQEEIVARGGRGGWGNLHYVSSTNQAPRRSDPGQAGEVRELRLVLKLIADVGLVGWPNVGKSTFLSVVSRARPKVADYPFTTLTPNLGVADLPDDRVVVIADVPGLIEGASEGRGLGVRFLKHLERTKVLLHLVTVFPGEERDPFEDWRAIREEMAAYDETLAAKPEVVALTKMDLPFVEQSFEELRAKFEAEGVTLFGVSAPSQKSVRPVLEKLWQLVEQQRRE
jgi:GTP-binding protein